MEKFTDFYEAYTFLHDHNMVYLEDKSDFFARNYFATCLDIDVVKVNPATGAIDADETLNTKTDIWLEFGAITRDEHTGLVMPMHDIDLDCGGDTFEEAILELANLVMQHYGYDKPVFNE